MKCVLLCLESGGFSDRNLADVLMFKKRILLFNRKVDLLRNPFHNVVRHLMSVAKNITFVEAAQMNNNNNNLLTL